MIGQIRRSAFPIPGGGFMPPTRLGPGPGARPGMRGVGGVGLWPFTNGLTTETLTPLGELDSVKQQTLYASADTPVYGPGYVSAAGSVVANVPAGQPLGVITDYGTDSNGVLWWYLEVSGTNFAYVGKILGGHVYVQDDPAVTFSTGPTPGTAKEILNVAAPALPSLGMLAVLGVVALLLVYRPGR